MKIVAYGLMVILVHSAALAQGRLDWELGARGGAPITKPFSQRERFFVNIVPCCQESTESFDRTFIVGPTVGLTISNRVLIEFEALHRPVRGNAEVKLLDPVTTLQSQTTRGSNWDFPLVVEYLVLDWKVRPYGGGGVVLVSSQSRTGKSMDYRREQPLVSNFKGTDWFASYVINAGLEWKSGGSTTIRPEVRYSHWSRSISAAELHKHQLEYLVGFSFHPIKLRRFK